MKLFLVAGEPSGDQLGASLMRALRRHEPRIAFAGVGGPAMTAEGLASLFPMADIAVMGFLPVAKKLPMLIARIKATAAAACAAQPDALVIIDSPDFTHRVARRVRRAMPHIPIIDYVSPTVWAWRPGRARAMRAYIDHVLALLPFEPDAYRRLEGPPCTYVGHPLVERLKLLQPNNEETGARAADPPLLLVLPGSRRSEIRRLMPRFAETLRLVRQRVANFTCLLPAVDHLKEEIEAAIGDWPVRPQLICDEAAKFAAFRRARTALCASGTVTLELALAHVPMVVAYEVSWLESHIRHLITVPSIVLPNLILGENRVPEFLQEHCRPDHLSAALAPLLLDGPERAAQMHALSRVAACVLLDDGETPSERAARLIGQVVASAAR
jgi:lipid-A-disaccharide synthase